MFDKFKDFTFEVIGIFVPILFWVCLIGILVIVIIKIIK